MNNINDGQKLYDENRVDISETADAYGIELILNNGQSSADNYIKKIQMSMVFIGLREYVDTSYPDQILYPNNFIYNYADKFLDGTTASIPIGTVNILQTGGGTFYDAFVLVENTFTSNSISHIFCGIYSIDLRYENTISNT